MAKSIEHTLSGGNVFADLALPDADEQLAKAEMAVKIARLLESRKLTQKALGELLEASQPDVSLLANHRFGRFSTARLLHFLVRLGQDREITIKARQGAKVWAGSPSRPQNRERFFGILGKDADLADEHGDCKRCGHPSDPHVIVAFDVTDFSRGGRMYCAVDGCTCESTVSFNIKPS